MGQSESASILAILVLYKRRPEESPAYLSLSNLPGDRIPQNSIELMICDNSPTVQPSPAGFKGLYKSDVSNPGLAKHYNDALQVAKERGIPWLMLFDHDTTPTEEYLEETLTQITALEQSTDVVALVPKLHNGKLFCSPYLRPTWSHQPLPPDQSGLSDSTLYAFNSGAILRVEALLRAGGFPREFPIEFLDYATFSEIQKDGGRVHVMRSILRHELAMSNAKTGVSLERYRNMLRGEKAFHAKYGTRSDRFYHRVRLLKNTLRFLIKDRHPRMAAKALRASFDFHR